MLTGGASRACQSADDVRGQRLRHTWLQPAVLIGCSLSPSMLTLQAEIDPMVARCWSNVYNVGPTSTQHRVTSPFLFSRSNAGSMFVQRLRRWTYIDPALDECLLCTVQSTSSPNKKMPHPQEVLLAQFSLYVHKGCLKPDSFHLHHHPFPANTRHWMLV